MLTTTEQSTAKLRLLPKPIDEMSDEELGAYLDSVIRPARGRLAAKKPRAAKTAAKKPTNEGLDDFDSIAD